MEIRPAELLKRWKAGQFAPFYYFVGEEAAAKAETLSQLRSLFGADDFNVREFSGNVDEEAAAIVSEAATLPAFCDKRLVIVRSPRIPASAKETLAAYLKDPLTSTTLVLLCDDKKPDAKDPLAKAADALGGLCVFAAMDERDAAKRLAQEAQRLGKALAPEAAALLIGEAGTDWGILSGELEKVSMFVGQAAQIGPDDVLACLGYRKASNPWTISDLIERRDLKGALAQLQALVKEGKPEDQARTAFYKIRDVVSRQLKARRLLRASVPPDQIARSIRVQPWKTQEFFGRMAKFTEARLRRDLKRCIETETALNSKSWLDARVEVEQLVIAISQT